METPVQYLALAIDSHVEVDHLDNVCILDATRRPLTTRNLAELERDLAQLERMLTPLLNQVRAMQGKGPMRATRG